jgi:hypothetical protein
VRVRRCHNVGGDMLYCGGGVSCWEKLRHACIIWEWIGVVELVCCGAYACSVSGTPDQPGGGA